MFSFKQFSVDDALTAMKVGTDGVLVGAWADGGSRILDIGTGSGLIALMMAQRFPESLITAIDIDPECCLQAKKNADASPFKKRISVVNASLQDFAADSLNSSAFDAIVCNPPFYQNSLKSPDSKRNLARHADTLSLHDLIVCSKSLLTPTGRLSVIVPSDIKESLESEGIINGLSIFSSVLLKPTLKKSPNRIMVDFTMKYQPGLPLQTEHLMEADGSRSEWYYNLTKDFYTK